MAPSRPTSSGRGASRAGGPGGGGGNSSGSYCMGCGSGIHATPECPVRMSAMEAAARMDRQLLKKALRARRSEAGCSNCDGRTDHNWSQCRAVGGGASKAPLVPTGRFEPSRQQSKAPSSTKTKRAEKPPGKASTTRTNRVDKSRKTSERKDRPAKTQSSPRASSSRKAKDRTDKAPKASRLRSNAPKRAKRKLPAVKRESSP